MREKDKHDGSVYEKPRVHSERKKNGFRVKRERERMGDK